MNAQPASTTKLPTWAQVCGGLVIAFGLPELNLGGRLAPGSSVAALLLRELVWWAIAGLLLVYVLRVEGQPLRSIGLRRPGIATFFYALVLAVLLFASVLFSYAVLFPLLGLKMNQATVEQITSMPFWLQLMVFVRAGVVEEILYRGYPIERLEKRTGRTWIAFLVSVVVFTLAHLGSWGGAQLIVVGFAAVLLGLWYLWRRDLVCNMIAHVLVDVTGFVMAGAHHA